MPEIGVGLIGYGLAGRVFHAPLIRAVPRLRLAAVVQRSGDDATRAFPEARVVRSADELLSLADIRLVVIATPNTSHFELTRKSLQAGRDVIVDKPFAPTSQEAAELIRIAQRSGRLLSVFQNRRWDGDFLTVRGLLRENTLGQLVVFESHFDRYRPEPRPGSWREQAEPGSGVLFDLGSHLVDQAIQLFGPPLAVTADIRIERERVAADDAFDVVLHYPGMRAVLGATMLAAEPKARFILHGTQGSYVKHGLDPQEALLASGKLPGDNNWAQEPAEAWGSLTVPVGDTLVRKKVATEPGDYRRYYENVRDALLRAAPLEVTAEQATEVIRVLELARESSRERRTVAFKAAAADCGS